MNWLARLPPVSSHWLLGLRPRLIRDLRFLSEPAGRLVFWGATAMSVSPAMR